MQGKLLIKGFTQLSESVKICYIPSCDATGHENCMRGICVRVWSEYLFSQRFADYKVSGYKSVIKITWRHSGKVLKYVTGDRLRIEGFVPVVC